jgi:predicted tellurium resistance membrane protein TerC
VNYFINKYSRIKLLALLLLLLVGFMLICHGFGWEYSEWYLYGAILILAGVILPPWKKWFNKIKL